MDEAAAGEGDQIRLALAPPRQRRGPLLGATDLVGVPARQDHAAVDDAGHDRGQLAGGHGDHRLVQERQALPYPAVLHSMCPCAWAASANRSESPKRSADRHRLARRRRGALQVAARLLLEDRGQEHVAALHALALVAIEQPTGAPEPAAGAPHVAVGSERDAHPEGAAQAASSSPASR